MPAFLVFSHLSDTIQIKSLLTETAPVPTSPHLESPQAFQMHTHSHALRMQLHLDVNPEMPKWGNMLIKNIFITLKESLSSNVIRL